MNVLIIDDREDSRDLLKAELAKLDSDEEFVIIGESKTGDDYEQFFISDIKPDIIFLDKKFDINGIKYWTKGFTIARRIKSSNPEVKIIMMTEFSEKLEFADIHSTGLLDGYISKRNLFNNRRLLLTIYGAIDNTPQWDVSNAWLKYSIEENLPNLKVRYAGEKSLDIEHISDIDEDFQNFLRDERCRLNTGINTTSRLTITQWNIFKMIAMGYSSIEVSKETGVSNLNTHNGNIRSKIGCEGNSNQAMYLIKAIELQIPEVVDKISGLSKCSIRFDE